MKLGTDMQADPYVGEIRLFGGLYAPVGWAFCHGQLLPIAEYKALFSVLGSLYGGDGQTTFALPDLRGRIPVGAGPSRSGSVYPIGGTGGAETVALLPEHLPAHTHAVAADAGPANQTDPTLQVWGRGTESKYTALPPDATMNPKAIASTGGGGVHGNMMPFQVVSFIIALTGAYPGNDSRDGRQEGRE
ncbi:phage tail protein [Paenibacillus sp. HJGM_3]|uniref:phage tail protein n=1 Tax=Paenibacillus sp. HJGM_3 TaxID=3379816 RepID=UPI0038582342